MECKRENGMKENYKLSEKYRRIAEERGLEAVDGTLKETPRKKIVTEEIRHRKKCK